MFPLMSHLLGYCHLSFINCKIGWGWGKKEWLGKCVSILGVEKQEQERGESIGDGDQVD